MLVPHRMAQVIEVDQPGIMVEPDQSDAVGSAERKPYDATLASDRDVVVYRISGAFFFGAAAAVGAALDRIGQHPKAYVIDFSSVPIVDSTAAATIEGFARKAKRQGATVFISGTRPPIRRILLTHGLRPPIVRFRAQLAEAVEVARNEVRSSEADSGVIS